jgi:hypothetical protein
VRESSLKSILPLSMRENKVLILVIIYRRGRKEGGGGITPNRNNHRGDNKKAY